MSEFTKGPWSIEHSRMSNGILEEDEAISICTDDSNCLDICAVWRDIPIGDEKANANLIAAAPDMYEALEYCLDCLGNEHALPSDCIDEVENALAKARGEL